jgi:aspartyl-tRNA synthetase
MTARVMTADVRSRVGQRVRLCGWAERLADGAGFGLRDGTGTVPLILEVGKSPRPEEAVEVQGTVVLCERGDGVAVAVDQLAVRGRVLAELPIGPDSPAERRQDWRFLDLRRARNHLIFEVQTTLERAMRQYWADHGFLELHSPKFRPNPNRSGRELFCVPYFDRMAYLVQSPQFYKQMAMAAGFDRVFEIGPVFRANPVATARHDTEFTSVDVEMSWIESDEEVMSFEEQWLRHSLGVVAREHGEAIAQAFGVPVRVPDVPFPRIPLEEARRIVEGSSPELAQPPGDLDAAGEGALGQHVARTRGHEFVFVTDYPEKNRPFYHMRRQAGSELTRGFDLLWKGMEVTTGAQREHRYETLVRQAEDHGIPLEPIRYYLDCFRFGCPPHGGFGLGLTRALMALLGVADVREVTFLFRGPDRLSP